MTPPVQAKLRPGSSVPNSVPRLPREHGIWYVQHSGRGGSSIFVNLHEYHAYLTDLVVIAQSVDVRIHAWCLIRNDVQLMLGNVSRAGLRRLMTRLAARHVFRQCAGDELPDFVFEPRLQMRRLYAAKEALEVASEIDLLPVRRALVSAPDRYLWSSYNNRVGGTSPAAPAGWKRVLGKRLNAAGQNIIDPEAAYLDLASGPTARRLAYQQYVDDRISQLQREISLRVEAAEMRD